MTENPIPETPELGDRLFGEFAGYLRILYSLEPEEVRRQESQSLVSLALSVRGRAEKTVEEAFRGHTKYIHWFAAYAARDLEPPCFAYICWDPARPLGEPFRPEQPCAADGNAAAAASLPENEKRRILKKRIQIAYEYNLRVLQKWCDRLDRSAAPDLDMFLSKIKF